MRNNLNLWSTGLLVVLVAAVSALMSHQTFAAEQTSVRPDIVVFLSDDHTWRDSSVYGSDIPTPNMQRLADAGMTLNNAFVASPSCAPSRAALLTGMYPARNGAEANHSRPRVDLKKLPAFLQDAGYEVAAFGKVAHYQHTPEYGFDVARHFTYHDDVAVDEAIAWLRHRKSDKPLCLMVGTNWPHVPWPENTNGLDPTKITVPPNHVDTPQSRLWRTRYVAAIRTMDLELGKVYDAAREVLGEETFFLHTSDHGAQWPFGKWTLYEDGIRTPMIASWPGRIASGVRSDAMVSWIDILPTLLDVAGAAPPSGLDGKSFLPVLEGKTGSHRDVIFTTHSSDGNYNVFPIRSALSAEGWKYIRNLHPEYRFGSHVTRTVADNGYWTDWVESAGQNEHARSLVRRYQYRPPEELYHIPADPWEQSDRIADPAHKERVAGLRQQLDQWMRETGDTQTVFGEPQFLAASKKPNVITVFIDDMGWSDLSCFGGKRTTTENIDRLAAEGIRFRNFYVNSPICSPSRVALSTGQYPHRYRITSYLDNRRRNEERGVAQWLDPNAPMIAREFHRAGYATGHFGKWHMGGQRDVGDAPLINAYGFDRSLTNFEGLGPRVLPLADAGDGEPSKRDLGSAALGKGPIRWHDRSSITTEFVNEAITFIDQSQTNDQPFFLNLWPDDVHSPFFPPKALRDKTDGSKAQLYGAVLDAMDQQLGKLFDRVRNDPALRDNTLILIMSDNGHEEGAGSSVPLRGGKTWLYEGGVRSPLIVWGPGFMAPESAGTINDTSVLCALDVNRSLYTFADIALPETTQPLDGEDVMATLLGKSTAGRKSPIYWRRPPDRPGRPDEDNPDLAVRDGRWKYLVNYDGSSPQLYDLANDPSEKTNLVNDQPSVVLELHQALMTWNSQMPRDAGDPLWEGHFQTSSLEPGKFVNPIGEGADPWAIRDSKAPRYLWCLSDGNRAIAVHTSESVTSMGQKHIVWTAPEAGPVSKEIWAPEMHYLDDRWYIYFAASDGKNENHLAYVLQSKTGDPLGEYELHGPMATGEGADGKSPNIWAIDMTVLEHSGKRYAVWSGWDQPGSDQQYLYIAPMKSPLELAGPRTRLCDNDDHLWERIEPEESKRGLHEGPQVFQAKGSTSLVYSCGASWLPTYKLGLLELVGSDPLLPSSWKKRPKPVFEGTESTCGVGHSCFVKSLDDEEWWHIFHAKRDRDPGWRRAVFAQPMRVGARGFPIFGVPIDAGKVLDRPSGGKVSHAAFSPRIFDYFGHHQFVAREDDRIMLGKPHGDPINAYRSGEKVVFSGVVPQDLNVEVSIDFHGDKHGRDAGILFRTTGASVGYDAQRGYFAGLIPETQLVILGKTDGTSWKELARAPTEIDPSSPQQLSIRVTGDEMIVLHNGKQKIQHTDGTYDRGSVGLRVVDTAAGFSGISVAPLLPGDSGNR